MPPTRPSGTDAVVSNISLNPFHISLTLSWLSSRPEQRPSLALRSGGICGLPAVAEPSTAQQQQILRLRSSAAPPHCAQDDNQKIEACLRLYCAVLSSTLSPTSTPTDLESSA